MKTKVSNTEKTKFLTCKGIKTPKFIWIGIDNFGNSIKETSKKSLQSAIDRNNRVYTKHPELLAD